MKKQITILILGLVFLFSFVFVSALQEPYVYYKLNLHYNNLSGQEDISVVSRSIEVFNNPLRIRNTGNHIIELRDVNGAILNQTYFGIPNEIIWDSWDEETGEIVDGGFEILDEVDFEVYLSYEDSGSEIVISRTESGEIINELWKSSINDNAGLDDVEGDVDDLGDTDKKDVNLTWLLGGVFVLLLGVLIYILVKKK
jgi:hypothetical protein